LLLPPVRRAGAPWRVSSPSPSRGIEDGGRFPDCAASRVAAAGDGQFCEKKWVKSILNLQLVKHVEIKP
jgi:hypothetical protein